MADADSYTKYHLNFEVSALDPGALAVTSMRGREEISRPYEFDLEVVPTGDLPLTLEEFEEIMSGTATISFGPDREHPIRGVVRSIEVRTAQTAADCVYRMKMVPRLADARLTRGSWIYQSSTPAEIVSKALTETLPEDGRFVDGEDFELSLTGNYTPREYVVQYEESVFDFVSRQAEHWGIFYFFDHLGETERIVFGDTNGEFPQLGGFEEIAFDATATDSHETIQSISASQNQIEHQVSLRDYNYRIPSVELVTPPLEVDAQGVGDVHVTGDHFWSPGEGAALAQLRSEEMFTRKLRMSAESRVRGLRAGHRFTLTGSTPEFLGLARDYLVLTVEHEYDEAGSQRSERVTSYRNVLTLLPYECAFRPARSTPKPRIYGMMHAKVDSEGGDNETNAPVDDWGRYKVVMPFDVAGEPGGQASCWIRLATPSAGGAWGISNTIHYGVEVALYHVDGDPDRPVIAAALPNFENRPVVTSQNSDQNMILTRSGLQLFFTDS